MTQPDARATPELPPLVRRTVERLIRAFVPDQVVLFGSYAKGTTHFGSDVDLLVIANIVGDRSVHQRRAKHLAADCFPPVDVVIATPDDVENASTARSPFLLSILETASTIYTGPNAKGREAGGELAK